MIVWICAREAEAAGGLAAGIVTHCAAYLDDAAAPPRCPHCSRSLLAVDLERLERRVRKTIATTERVRRQ